VTGKEVGIGAVTTAGRVPRRRRSERFTTEGSGAVEVGDREVESTDEPLDRTVQQVRPGGAQKSHVSGKGRTNYYYYYFLTHQHKAACMKIES